VTTDVIEVLVNAPHSGRLPATVGISI